MGSSGKVALFKPVALLIGLCFILISGGCASLPDAERVVRESPTTHDSPPKIQSANRQLTTRESRSVIARLRRQNLPTDILKRHLAVEEAIAGSPLIVGNKVTLLVDGPATYAAMFKAIRNAKDHINLETYIFAADEAGREFADLLLQKASEGVQVNVIYDSIGSLGTPSAFFRHLQHGGVQVLEFNPVNPLLALAGRRMTHRDHRKILVVDGTIAFTGGVNISRVYSRSFPLFSGQGEKQSSWRDTDVQIEGPAVAEFQKLFLDTWKREHGPELSRGIYFPELKHEGDELVRVIGNTPGEMNRATYITYFSAITFASDSIHLTNSYFVPDERTLEALSDAARRGVDVKLILPSHSDSRLTYYAGRYYYSRLLKSGVKLYELRDAVLHAKTIVIDGVWSSVGSTNMDLWSFLRDDEVNAVILGRSFADQMEAMFKKDLDNSDEVSLEKWKKRSLSDRLKEVLSRPFKYWL